MQPRVIPRAVQYFKRYIPPGGLDEIRLVGAYRCRRAWQEGQAASAQCCEMSHATCRATLRDDDDMFYSATLWSSGLLLGCGGSGTALSVSHSSSGHPAAAAAAAEAEAVAAFISPGEREALMAGDLRVAMYRLLGMHLFVGGISHAVLQRLEVERG